VQQALEGLPPNIRERLENVDILIVEEPTPQELAEAGLEPGDTLFGLYQGVPLTERATDYGLVLPDRITLFRRPLLEWCRSEEELVEEVRKTVVHEVGHFFGLGEEELADY
jgi:predicted Zn-dependent protease with MMP-like domain